MSVNQTRQNDMVAQIQHFVRALRQISLAADLFDKTIPAEDRGIFQLAVLPVHGDDQISVIDE
jgi:hypothetical protein